MVSAIGLKVLDTAALDTSREPKVYALQGEHFCYAHLKPRNISSILDI